MHRGRKLQRATGWPSLRERQRPLGSLLPVLLNAVHRASPQRHRLGAVAAVVDRADRQARECIPLYEVAHGARAHRPGAVEVIDRLNVAGRFARRSLASSMMHGDRDVRSDQVRAVPARCRTGIAATTGRKSMTVGRAGRCRHQDRRHCGDAKLLQSVKHPSPPYQIRSCVVSRALTVHGSTRITGAITLPMTALSTTPTTTVTRRALSVCGSAVRR